MTDLVRFLESAGIWADVADLSDLIPETTPLEVLADVCATKGQGASYFACEANDPSSLGRAVAAYSGCRKNLETLTIGMISLEELQNLGIECEQTNNPGPDSEFSSKFHYDVRVKNVEEAIKLANVIRNNIKKIAQKEVEHHFCQSVSQGWVALGGLQKELLSSLAKRNLLEIRKPPVVTAQAAVLPSNTTEGAEADVTSPESA